MRFSFRRLGIFGWVPADLRVSCEKADNHELQQWNAVPHRPQHSPAPRAGYLRAKNVGVALKTALTTAESRLRQTVQEGDTSSHLGQVRLARWRYGEHLPAELLHFLIKQAEEDPPSLI